MQEIVAEVVIYATRSCPYCRQAKALLSRKGIPFREVDLTDDDEGRVALAERTGARTVPQIFIGDRLVGGFTDLRKLDEDGELDALAA